MTGARMTHRRSCAAVSNYRAGRLSASPGLTPPMQGYTIRAAHFAHAKQYSGVGNAPLFTSRTKFCTASCTDAAPFM